MKNKASGCLKQTIAVITSIAKAKSSIALKSTKTGAIKSRLVVLSLLRNKKVLLSAITHKIHGLLPGHRENEEDGNGDDEKQNNEVVLYGNGSGYSYTGEFMANADIEDEDEKYPYLTHSLFDDLDDDQNVGSVIEIMRHSKEEDGEEFVLEDEIDEVADLFIKKFHRQIRIQKQLSFKRYQEMLERSV